LEDLSTLSQVFKPGGGDEGEDVGGDSFDLNHELHKLHGFLFQRFCHLKRWWSRRWSKVGCFNAYRNYKM